MYGQEIAWTEGRKKAFKSVAKDLPKYLDPTKWSLKSDFWFQNSAKSQRKHFEKWKKTHG